MKDKKRTEKDRFLELCARKNCGLAYFASHPEDERVLLAAFFSQCADPVNPEKDEARRFLEGAGRWLACGAEEFLTFARAKAFVPEAPEVWQGLAGAVERHRAEKKSSRRKKALKMERDAELSKIDTSFDEYWMTEALTDAKMALLSGEVPVGAVIVENGKLIARGRNAVVTDRDPTAHAEMIAIRSAAKRKGSERLENATLYVTLEPCAMCSGAIRHSRIGRVVYGADAGDESRVCGSCGLLAEPEGRGGLVVTRGVLAGECQDLLKTFFAARREAAASQSDEKK
jgi:tRNA(Arg) A34 adenosine deaminase TadA